MLAERVARDFRVVQERHPGCRVDFGSRNKHRRLWSGSVVPFARSSVGLSVRCPRTAGALRRKRKPVLVSPGRQFREGSQTALKGPKAEMSRKLSAIFALTCPQRGC